MLLLLHGALGDKSQFDALRTRLVDRELSAMDFEGHGRTAGRNRALRMECLVDNVIELLDR